MTVEALRWKGDALELLDQRLLPERIVYVTCRTAAEVAAAIRDMVVRGAPAIGCAAAFGVALEPKEASYAVLAQSRPTAVNLFWALERMRRARDKRAEAEAIFAEDLAVTALFGRETPCSSTKGATGHTLGAAGALEAVATALALRHGFVPGGAQTRHLDPALHANYRLETQPASLQHALSNSFGFGGTNCSLVLGRA